MTTFNAYCTFLNGDEKHEQKGRDHFANVINTLEFYQEYGPDLEGYEHAGKTRRDLLEEGYDRHEVKEILEVVNTFEDIGDFYDYGLCFDFVEADENLDGYYRLQICWGGPSSEIRIFNDGTIEAVYLDWFVGVGFEVSSFCCMQWLVNWFEATGSIDWDSLDYEQVHQLDNEEV